MADTAIQVEQLSKRYRIGRRATYRRFSDVVTGVATAPLRWLARKAADDANEFWALKDVSFSLAHGEVLGIIGHNGAGKSTLLKILSRVTSPTSGRATTHGRVGSLLEVGTGFHPELTGRENIFLSGAILGMRKAEIARKFDEIVAFAEVEKFLDTQVKHYSSGMYERLAFAVAAHLEPEILIVDEVLAVGDLAFQKKCLGKMSSVANSGRTVLFVSHNMSAIEEICSRVLMLKQGTVLEDGVPSKVIARYIDEAITGSNPDNDVRQAPRVNSLPNSRLKFVRVRASNTAGALTAVFAFGEPIVLDIFYEVTEDVLDVRLGFTFALPVGSDLFNTFQVDQGLPTAFSRGAWCSRVKLDPNLLAPGVYEVRLGAIGPGVQEWVNNTMELRIDPVGVEGGPTWKSYSHGLMRHPVTWVSCDRTG